jgi:tRNA(Ile)-lysidine synthetase-like protein
MSLASNHIVHKKIASFLADRGVRPSGEQQHSGKATTTTLTPVIVSLSGGVDSMVIASVLAHLCHECNYPLKIVAIHIDYANRPESGAEAAYVSRYCCDSLRIAYKCRRIDEVTRGVTARADYERVAREARYGIYRQTVKELLGTNGDYDSSSSMEVGVILGHHRGDLRENVLSNSHKGCGPLDLSGMTAVSTNDGVVIYRPLLSLEKKEILDYAHHFGVPYFKDTTPHWSTRGKLRNKLLPLLQEIYGEGSMDNLSTWQQRVMKHANCSMRLFLLRFWTKWSTNQWALHSQRNRGNSMAFSFGSLFSEVLCTVPGWACSVTRV